MTESSPHDVAAIYADTRDQLIDDLRTLDTAQATSVVPTCPEWTVKDVVAHVVGLVADILAEVPPPLGTDEMTSRQVAERSADSLDEICDEWASNADAIVPFLVDVPLRGLGLTADLAVHVHDLAEAVESVRTPPVRATEAACARYVPLLQERAAEQLDIALAVELGHRQWVADAGATPLGMRGDATDFLRSVTGRRTRAQAEAAFEWDGDPGAMLDGAFTQYGPYRTD